MSKHLIEIKKDNFRGYNECLLCRSNIELKSIKFGRNDNNRISLTLCKACRNLLHKRLHEELEDTHE